MGNNCKRVLFICRGSIEDGFGHVIRSRSVAKVMKEDAETRMVVIGDQAVENLLGHHDLEYVITRCEEHVFRLFRDFAPDVVVFDLMHFDVSHFKLIAASCRSVSLSPIFNCMSQVDLMFHRTRVHGKDWPSGNKGPVIHCGLEYAIISDHCQKTTGADFRSNLEHETLAVAISMGGTDAANKTLAILNKVKHISDKILFWALLGEGYAHSFEDLVECIGGSKHEIILAKTNDSMWRILNTCSLVILAGGTTTYEAAFAGIPSINTLETSDHYFLIQELVDHQACACAGKNFQESLNALPGLITEFSNHREELWRLHKNSQKLIDGKAVQRIIREITALCRRG